MRKFMYFLPPDTKHMQSRLERLAEKGLELTSVEGLFSGEFEQTKRTDLQYLVLPYGAARNFARIGDYEPFGWELAGGFNGMAIFKSLPCVEPDAEGAREKMDRDGCLRPDHWTVPVLLVLVLAYAVLLFAAERWLPAARWYLSYLRLGLWAMRGTVLALAAANLVTLRSYASAWIHGLTPWILLGSVLFLVLTALLDETQQTAFFAVILLVLAVACFAGLWWRCLPLASVAAGACLLVLCLGLLFPNVDRADVAGRSLHNEMAEAPVVQLSDLGNEDALIGTGYIREGTFLVHRTSYWEFSDSASVSSEVYQCLTGSLADQIVSEQLSRSDWETSDDGWSTSEGKILLLRRRNTVALVSSSSTLTPEQVRVIKTELFG